MVKNPKDARYVRSEERLLDAFLVAARRTKGLGMRSRDVSRGAGLAASTFYRHHKSLRRMVGATQRKMMRKYERMLRRIRTQGGNLTDMIEGTFIFVDKYAKVFKTEVELGYSGTLTKMGEKMWGYVAEEGNDYGEEVMRQMRTVYSFELAGVMTMHIRQRVGEEELKRDLTKLSKRGAQRLNFMVL